VQGLHGHLNGCCLAGDISVSGVDGAVSLENRKGSISLNANMLRGRSEICATNGPVHINLNPEISAKVELEVNSGDLVVSQDQSSSPRIQIVSEQFHVLEQPKSSHILKGNFVGKVVDLSPKGKGRSSSQSGKIDRLYAQQYAFSSAQFSGNVENNPSVKDIPSVRVKSSHEIRVESLSWKDLIRRKFDMLQ
jgi:hypothetical protein